MNKAILVGRLTRDAELRTTGSGTSVCSFTLAVNRRFKNADGNYDADFINCVAWRVQAEFISKHFKKGDMFGIVGNLQTRIYEKDGNKTYITEVVVEEVNFVGGKKSDKGSDIPADDILPMPDGEELPY